MECKNEIESIKVRVVKDNWLYRLIDRISPPSKVVEPKINIHSMATVGIDAKGKISLNFDKDLFDLQVNKKLNPVMKEPQLGSYGGGYNEIDEDLSTAAESSQGFDALDFRIRYSHLKFLCAKSDGGGAVFFVKPTLFNKHYGFEVPFEKLEEIYNNSVDARKEVESEG